MTDTQPAIPVIRAPSGRLGLFDVLRAIAMLYIVGVWHLSDYLPKPHLRAISPAFFIFTNVCLGLFCFISGFLLTIKYDFAAVPPGGRTSLLVEFFRNRFLRIYPLFVLTLILYWQVLGSAVRPLLLSALLVSGVLDRQPGTLWFIGNLVVYYALFPMLSLGRTTLWPIGVGLTLAVGALAIRKSFGGVDLRLLTYMAPFVFGIVVARKQWLFDALRGRWMAVLSAVLLVSYSFNPWWPPREGGPTILPQAMLGLAPMLWLGEWLSRLPGQAGFAALSYASFCVYLLHRVVYGITRHEWHTGTGIATALLLLGIALPVTFAASYVLQHGYDKLINWMAGRSRRLAP